jgi:hypothetical protein
MRRSLVLLTVVVACLAGCEVAGLRPADKPATKSAAPAKPYLGGPKVGECHDLTPKQIQAESDTKKPVPCSSKHTTRTVAVVDAPPKSGSEDVQTFRVGEACAEGYKTVVGGDAKTRVKTLYSLAWFHPTKAQKAKGAKWMRCDVTLTDPKRAYPLESTVPFLDGKPTKDEQRCGDLSAGDGVRWEFVPCSADHLFVPKKYVEAAEGVTFDQAEAEAKKACDDGLYIWSTPEQWGIGDRFYVCWGPAKPSADDDAIVA